MEEITGLFGSSFHKYSSGVDISEVIEAEVFLHPHIQDAQNSIYSYTFCVAFLCYVSFGFIHNF
jgi:hypothetical protein